MECGATGQRGELGVWGKQSRGPRWWIPGQVFFNTNSRYSWGWVKSELKRTFGNERRSQALPQFLVQLHLGTQQRALRGKEAVLRWQSQGRRVSLLYVWKAVRWRTVSRKLLCICLWDKLKDHEAPQPKSFCRAVFDFSLTLLHYPENNLKPFIFWDFWVLYYSSPAILTYITS